MKTKILGLLAMGLLLGPMAANAAVFGFEFDNSTGNVNGSVTGRIFGLQDNGSSQTATSVLIDSFPTALAANDGLADNDVMNWQSAFNNSFTVKDGQIRSAFFAGGNVFIVDKFDMFSLGGVTYSPSCCEPISDPFAPFLTMDNGRTVIGGGALRFTRIAEVTEPGTLALLCLGLVGMGMRRRIKAS